MSGRKRNLTPLESELRFGTEAERRPGFLERRRNWRRERRAPTTRAGAIAHGLIRLTLLVAGASGIAYLISLGVGRGPAFGFYLVGALVLSAALFVSGVHVEAPFSSGFAYWAGGRRIGTGPAYVLVGAIVVGIGVAVEFLSR